MMSAHLGFAAMSAMAAMAAAIIALGIAHAGDETATPASDVGGVPPCKGQQARVLCPRLTQGAGSQSIVWQPVEGAASYRVEADGGANRVNATDPYCTAPLADDVYVIAIDAIVANGIAELQLGLPPLPAEDAWLIKSIRVTVTALDADDSVLKTDGFAFTAEAGCDDPSGRRPPSKAATQLPGAGAPSGDYSDYGYAAKAPIGIAIATIGAGILAFALWKQSRAPGR